MLTAPAFPTKKNLAPSEPVWADIETGAPGLPAQPPVAMQFELASGATLVTLELKPTPNHATSSPAATHCPGLNGPFAPLPVSWALELENTPGHATTKPMLSRLKLATLAMVFTQCGPSGTSALKPVSVAFRTDSENTLAVFEMPEEWPMNSLKPKLADLKDSGLNGLNTQLAPRLARVDS